MIVVNDDDEIVSIPSPAGANVRGDAMSISTLATEERRLTVAELFL